MAEDFATWLAHQTGGSVGALVREAMHGPCGAPAFAKARHWEWLEHFRDCSGREGVLADLEADLSVAWNEYEFDLYFLEERQMVEDRVEPSWGDLVLAASGTEVQLLLAMARNRHRTSQDWAELRALYAELERRAYRAAAA